MPVNPDFSDLFSALNAVEARYLMVGGYAVSFHAEPRFTKDLDVWVEPTPANAQADVPIHVIGRHELIRNKRACGRPQDLVDADRLAGGD